MVKVADNSKNKSQMEQVMQNGIAESEWETNMIKGVVKHNQVKLVADSHHSREGSSTIKQQFAK